MSYISLSRCPHHLSSPSTVFEELLPVCCAIAILTFLLHQQGTVIIYMMSAWLIANAIEKHIHISSLLLYNPPSYSTSFFFSTMFIYYVERCVEFCYSTKSFNVTDSTSFGIAQRSLSAFRCFTQKTLFLLRQPREAKLETTFSLPPGKLQCKSNHIS
jgi:hypothetical protein